MSINSMNKSVVATRRTQALQALGVEGAPAPGVATPAGAPDTGPLSDLARYIPTEVITIYVAFLGLATVTNGDYTPRWVGYGIFAFVTALAVVVDWEIKERKLPAGERTKVPKFNVFAGVSAFAAWGFALPGTPFQDLSWYDAKWAAFAALVVSYALGKGGALWGPVDQRPA